MLNKVELIGRLGRNPELLRTNAGDRVVNFSIATNEKWKDKHSGERRERVEWHNVVIWNDHFGKIAEQYLSKGSLVYISGKLRTREFEGNDGVKRKATEVVLEKFGGELLLIDTAAARNSTPDTDDEAPF